MLRVGIAPVALGFIMRLDEDCEGTARLDDAAAVAEPTGTTAKRTRKMSLRGQKTNHDNGP